METCDAVDPFGMVIHRICRSVLHLIRLMWWSALCGYPSYPSCVVIYLVCYCVVCGVILIYWYVLFVDQSMKSMKRFIFQPNRKNH